MKQVGNRKNGGKERKKKNNDCYIANTETGDGRQAVLTVIILLSVPLNCNPPPQLLALYHSHYSPISISHSPLPFKKFTFPVPALSNFALPAETILIPKKIVEKSEYTDAFNIKHYIIIIN